MIRRLLNVIELTPPEQRVVIVGLAALLAFVGVNAYRSSSARPSEQTPLIDSTQPSPSPGIRP